MGPSGRPRRGARRRPWYVFFAYCSIGDTRVGADWREWAGLDTHIVRTVRFEREGDTLRVSASTDDVEWREVLAVTLPDEFLWASQQVLIGGSAWFDPRGSYADYDYVRFERGD